MVGPGPPPELAISAYTTPTTGLLPIAGKELRALCEQDDRVSAGGIARLASIIGRRLVQLERMLAKEIESNAPSI